MQLTSLAPLPKASPATTDNDFEQRHNALNQPYDLRPDTLLARQAARESNARSYPRRIPLALRRAQGLYVEDTNGRVFIDCLAGAGTLALGHNHPVVIEAIQRVLADGAPLHTLDLMTPVKDRFIEDLFDTLPAPFARDARVLFCGPTGADAVEASLKLVKTATGRTTMLAFDGAYHGMTQGVLQLMGNLGPKIPVIPTQHGVQFLPYPYDFRCPFGLRGDAGVRAGLHYITNVLTDPESGVPQAAGMILEVVQGEGGVIPAPDAWLRGVRESTTRAGIPLIIDEVQTGFGRTGRMFAFEHAGITPDVVVLSKAIGGSLPLSVVVYRSGLDLWKPGAHAGTFRGNQLAMAAGSATMRFIRDEALPTHADVVGRRLLQGLQQLKSTFPLIGDVRGRGLMIGVEIVDPAGTGNGTGPDNGIDHSGSTNDRPASGILARRLQAECLRHGLILEVGGRHGSVVRFLPPLIITEQQIDRILDIFTLALARTALSENTLAAQ